MNINRNEKKLLKILQDDPYISQKDIAQIRNGTHSCHQKSTENACHLQGL